MLKQLGPFVRGIVVCSIAMGAFHVAQATPENSLDQLHQKISRMNQQLSTIQHSNILTSNPKIHRSLNQVAQGPLMIDHSKGVFFEAFPHTRYGLAFMQSKNKFLPQSIDFGGYFEGDTQYWHSPLLHESDKTKYDTNGSGSYVTTASLDFMSNFNSWVSSFVSVSTDNTMTSDVAKAFVAFGNLNQTPIYLIVGKNYVPFGIFSGAPWSPSLSKSAFRPGVVPQIDLSYYDHGLNTNLVLLNSKANHHVSNFVYSAFYTAKAGPLGYTLGAGYLNDIRGLGSNLDNLYVNTNGTLKSSKRNSLWDLFGSVNYNIWQLMAEYTRADQNTPTANIQQGKASGMFVSLSAAPKVLGKVTTFEVGYNQTSNLDGVKMSLPSKAIDLPLAPNGLKRMVFGTVSRKIDENVVLSGEYVRTEGYHDKYDNTVTMDLSVYI